MPLRRNAKIGLIRSVPLFSACSKRELAQIAAVADEIDLPAGKTLIKEAERGRQFFAVIEGEVAARKKGRAVPIKGGRDFFGEISLVSNAPTNATVTTTTPLRALVITDRAFSYLLHSSPQIQLKILRPLAERLAPEAL